MPASPDPCPMAIVTACMARDGVPTFALTEVAVTAEEAANGVHFYLAEAQLLTDGYEEPFVHFGPDEAPPFLHAAVRQHLGLAPAAPALTTATPSEER